MKRFFFALLIFVSIFSCKNSQPDKDLSIVPKTTAINSADSAGLSFLTAQNANSLTDMPRTAVQASPNIQQTNTVAQTSPAQLTSSVGKSAAGLNPAHGQPGHRCDISPGAPLSSSPAPKAQAPGATITPPTQIQNQSPSAKSGVSANPPHGQPGHKCDVGANSNLTTGSSVSMPQTAPTLQGLPVMQPNSSPAPSVISSGSMGKTNPPHGQPGHVCK